MEAFDQCYLQQLEVFKTSCESADQLAIAIVNGCPNEMADFRSAAIRTFGLDKANQFGTQYSQKRQEQAIASLMRARLKNPCPH
ncbi:MAG: hypothetical protein EOS25_05030 [Mesorhizobium sp.]|uniref:hypothetical protein n=1 Tax=Mesorhizobium sp. TaxID=1871066 RepID=UPI000FE824CF|nr:hypothetical protein [Mesorhizobium sp.]RWD50868.1 MAG: hypothetical protein EOS59_07720 [Mesorhizobium sp.]RWE58569.1 MAG: hypothetical protein EOS24_17560 [Mesorhizobium sp.]RWF21396.1 MAG: hypothetical protein EOS25_05030 [Mesorhizobium sp.]TIW49551.1 MAG: hypothetical protein E5V71_01195 [Mesorhizobium sp.]TIY06921.1 MAG: hypothetical protein E5V22_01020 [Mesorhizobium sp.]